MRSWMTPQMRKHTLSPTKHVASRESTSFFDASSGLKSKSRNARNVDVVCFLSVERGLSGGCGASFAGDAGRAFCAAGGCGSSLSSESSALAPDAWIGASLSPFGGGRTCVAITRARAKGGGRCARAWSGRWKTARARAAGERARAVERGASRARARARGGESGARVAANLDDGRREIERLEQPRDEDERDVQELARSEGRRGAAAVSAAAAGDDSEEKRRGRGAHEVGRQHEHLLPDVALVGQAGDRHVSRLAARAQRAHGEDEPARGADHCFVVRVSRGGQFGGCCSEPESTGTGSCFATPAETCARANATHHRGRAVLRARLVLRAGPTTSVPARGAPGRDRAARGRPRDESTRMRAAKCRARPARRRSRCSARSIAAAGLALLLLGVAPSAPAAAACRRRAARGFGASRRRRSGGRRGRARASNPEARGKRPSRRQFA